MTPATDARDSKTDVPVPGHTRQIIRRTRGLRHGPITRLMSPGDLGEALKPFVFLDLFDMEKASFPGFGLHPHSGITTVTHLFEGRMSLPPPEELGSVENVGRAAPPRVSAPAA